MTLRNNNEHLKTPEIPQDFANSVRAEFQDMTSAVFGKELEKLEKNPLTLESIMTNPILAQGVNMAPGLPNSVLQAMYNTIVPRMENPNHQEGYYFDKAQLFKNYVESRMNITNNPNLHIA